MPENFPNDPKPFEILESKYLFQRPPWLTLREERLQLPSGGIIENFYLFEYPDWVNVIALTKQKEVVMIRQYRHGIKKVAFEIPAGVHEHGESLMDSAKRELLEETGFGNGRWEEWMQLSANPAIQSNITHTFIAWDVERIDAQALEPTEEITVHLLPLHEVKALILKGEMVQSLHLAPLLKLLMLLEEYST
jgi:8-oxo-dGDP phosphatase